MRRLQAQRPLRWSEKARSRRAAPLWLRLRSRARPAGSSRAAIVADFQLAGCPLLGRAEWLGGIAVDAVGARAIAQAAGEQAERLGAQKLRPAETDPPRRRAESRGAQDVRDRGGRNADAELQQLALDAHVAPAQRGFSRADRLIRLRVSSASGGRPVRRRCPRPPCSSVRCQRRSVCAPTAKQDQRSGGSKRLAAASNARSAVVYCVRFPPRLRIAS
jgi:hypothetical protein